MQKYQRGYVKIFPQHMLKTMYHLAKTRSNKQLKAPRVARFADHSHKVIDKDVYELKKDAAIQRLTETLGDQMGKHEVRLLNVVGRLNISREILAQACGVSIRTAGRIRQKAKDMIENG